MFQWIDNTLVSPSGDLYTILSDGTLEIRGKGWGRANKKNPGKDIVRICPLKDINLARQVAEKIVSLEGGIK